jgi:outer membrane protein OmpA-like peptidoglycan-associated protein
VRKYLILLLAFSLHSMCASAQNVGTPIMTTLHVTFPDKGSVFVPSEAVVFALADAKNAALIYVSGRTSTNTPSAADEALAFKRAASARAYLINLGISPLKIMVNYASASDFIADNKTISGRLQNQRVDIELVFVPTASSSIGY